MFSRNFRQPANKPSDSVLLHTRQEFATAPNAGVFEKGTVPRSRHVLAAQGQVVHQIKNSDVLVLSRLKSSQRIAPQKRLNLVPKFAANRAHGNIFRMDG
jgi:hypothetical protein